MGEKYLQKRNGIWRLRLARPPKSWGLKSEFVHSLKTPDLHRARYIRDKYFMPALVESSAVEAVQTLLHSLNQANEKVSQHLREFRVEIGAEKEDGLTVNELFQEYIKFRRKSKSTESTIATYQATSEVFGKLWIHNPPVKKLKKEDFSKLRDKLLSLPPGWMKLDKIITASKDHEKTLSVTTANNHLRRFRTVFTWAVSEGVIPLMDNPAAGISADTNKIKKSKRPMTEKECDSLTKMDYPKLKKVDRLTWEYLPIIARYTGCRLAEIALLNKSDFIEVDGIFCISINDFNKPVKTLSSVREVPISDKLKPFIEKLLDKVKDRAGDDVFRNRGDYKTKIAHAYSIVFNRRAKEIGEHCTFHGLRAYAITQMANAGIPEIDRKRIAGHSDDSTHAGYTADDLSRYKKAVDTIK